VAYQAANHAFCRFLEKEEEEILGRKDEVLFPAAEAAMSVKEDLRVMETGESLERDVEITGARGKKWLQMVKTPISDSNGVIWGILYSGRDISARKKAMETLQEHKARWQEIIAEGTLREPQV
jgi:PAS domain S-box-containing protein